jgi:AcrR family transcriptional regulator
MPAGRPRSFDPDKALDAAVGTFWKYGYDGASLDALTEAMGINRPSLYAAFGDKAALFESALRRYQATAWEGMRAALDEAPDAGAAIDAYFVAARRSVAGRGTPRGCLVASVLGDVSEADPRWRKLAAELVADGQRHVAERLRRFLPADKAARAATLMGLAAGGLAVLARTGGTPAMLDAALSVAIAATRSLAGLPPPAGTETA